MKLQIIEDFDNNDIEYGVLVTNRNGKVCIADFYDDKAAAYEFMNDAETMGRSVFDRCGTTIIEKRTDYEPDSYGYCYYKCTTSDGKEYLQRVKILNTRPIDFR